MPCCGCLLLGFPLCVPLFGGWAMAIDSEYTTYVSLKLITKKISRDIIDLREDHVIISSSDLQLSYSI